MKTAILVDGGFYNKVAYNKLGQKFNETGVRGFHIFRHTHASLLASEGISLETIQRRLGHESDEIRVYEIFSVKYGLLWF